MGGASSLGASETFRENLALPALLGGACPQGMLAIVSLGEDGYVACDRSARD